jgi:hypothetical protein
MTFDERIGGVLIAPRRTFARLVAGEARASDVAWLVVFRLVAGELDGLAHAFAVAREIGIGAGAQEVLMVAGAVLPDIVGILAAGLMLQLFCKARHAFDVAAYAWIPYLTVQLAGAFLFTALRRLPTPAEQKVQAALGVAWALVAWTLALVEARKAEPAAEAQS